MTSNAARRKLSESRIRENRTSGVRREALRCIPNAVGKNVEERSWVNGLTWTRKREGTRACQENSGRPEASRTARCMTRAIGPTLDGFKPTGQR